jgi:hypothetical protein
VLAGQIYSGTSLTWRQALVMVLWGHIKPVLTFGVLHRFLSHRMGTPVRISGKCC